MISVILSDIHGNLEALTSVLADVKRCCGNCVTQWIVLGDMIDYGADSIKVLGIIEDLGNKGELLCIQGNHEDALLKSIFNKEEAHFRTDHAKVNFEITKKEFTDGIPTLLQQTYKTYKYEIPNTTITIVHGSEEDPIWGDYGTIDTIPLSLLSRSEFNVSPTSKVVLGGHSHIQGKIKSKGYAYVNPGSVGQPRNGDNRAQYAIMETSPEGFKSFKFRRVEYDIKTAADKIIKSGRPSFLATRLFLGI